MSDRSEIRQRFMKVGSSNVADALDELGHGDQGLAADFTRYSGEMVAGWAYTIQGSMTPYEGRGDPEKMEACGGVKTDDVTVWAGGGRGVCYFGELIALGMQERGCVGALVDGGIRDVPWLGHHGFPVFARYRTPIQSIGRWKVSSWQTPLDLPGATTATVRVQPGDFVLADEDGAIVVPAALVPTVLELAEKLTATEVNIRAALARGKTLADCLAEFGHV